MRRWPAYGSGTRCEGAAGRVPVRAAHAGGRARPGGGLDRSVGAQDVRPHRWGAVHVANPVGGDP